MNKDTVMDEDTNIILIGMPGVGKSTSGVLCAKLMSRDFIDTDVYIQAQAGTRLQDIIDNGGLENFCRFEEESICSLTCRGYVISTGGSVVYSKKAMAHLKQNGIAVHLDLPFEKLEQRIDNMDSRGIVITPGQTFADLYCERQPLYEKYADITVDCDTLTHEQVGYAILEGLGHIQT